MASDGDCESRVTDSVGGSIEAADRRLTSWTAGWVGTVFQRVPGGALWAGWLLVWLVVGGCGPGLDSGDGVHQEPGSPTAQRQPSNPSTDPTPSPTTSSDAAEAVVRLRVVLAPSAREIEGQVAWRDGMSVYDATVALQPSLEVESSGQGESLFVKSLAGQANRGSAGDNWIYRVNGELGDRSCGVFPVQPGDQILWSFGKYE